MSGLRHSFDIDLGSMKLTLGQDEWFETLSLDTNLGSMKLTSVQY